MNEPTGLDPEAVSRRLRSITRIKAENIKVFERLPVIETASEAHIRTAEEVARRVMTLAVVAIKADARDHDWAQSLAMQFDVHRSATPEELEFLNSLDPDEDFAAFSWRYESMYALLWSIGQVASLDQPSGQIDVVKVVQPLIDLKPGALIEKAVMRSIDVILDEADVIYRYHWAIRDAWLAGRAIPGLDGGVVAERHRALNWLIRAEPWDDIDTAT